MEHIFESEPMKRIYYTFIVNITYLNRYGDVILVFGEPLLLKDLEFFTPEKITVALKKYDEEGNENYIEWFNWIPISYDN